MPRACCCVRRCTCVALLGDAGSAFAPFFRTKADRRTCHSQVAAEDADAPKGGKLPPPDISSFLRPAGLMETRYVRLLSSLCAQTYFMHRLTVRSRRPVYMASTHNA